MPTCGQSILHYRIVEKLGQGGMGEVFRARDTSLDRDVALKFLPHLFSGDPERLARFEREAKLLASLNHANIAAIHGFESAQGQPFLVLELVDGQTLADRIAEGPMPIDETIDICRQIAIGLEAAHQKGIIHRDLKPANVKITPEGQIKILDFGLARALDDPATAADQSHFPTTAAMTRSGVVLGTAAYMSPEQALGERVDQRTDVWSLGVVLYQMLTGRLPFSGAGASSVLRSIVHEEPRPMKDARPGLPAALQPIVTKALHKDRTARYASPAQMAGDLERYRDSLGAGEASGLTARAVLRAARKPRVAIPAAACLVLLSAGGAWWLHQQGRIRWARDQALPEIQQLLVSTEVGSANLPKAYKLAVQAERYIPGDATLTSLLDRCSGYINVETEPAGAAVYVKEVSALVGPWQRVGTSPIKKTRVPFGLFWWKVEKEGYEPVMAVAQTYRIMAEAQAYRGNAAVDFFRVLDPKGKIPPGMVRVRGGQTTAGRLDDFFVDRYEVTNKQYKQFVDAGGYRDRRYWKNAFVDAGKVLSWEEAMARFLDQTARPGPSTWQAGNHAKGQEDYPVRGVSWYEAAAYAEYAGKSLPTSAHWVQARGLPAAWFSHGGNFNGEGPAAVGTYPSMTAFGAYDMAGNVREWCWNETANGRAVRGGAWNDFPYMTSDLTQEPPFDRSPKNGFRCVLYPNPGKIPEKAFAAVEVVMKDFAGLAPVPDAVFQVYKEQFSYDKKALNARVEWRSESAPDWIQEKVTVDAAYGNERLPIYLFLPKTGARPHQTVIYLPGSGSTEEASSRDLEHYSAFVSLLEFLVKNGRSVVYPIYKGTFERRDDALTAIVDGALTRQYSEFVIQVVKDLRTSVDYLDSRPDIDRDRLACLGLSYGGRLTPIALAVEDRVKAGIVVVGGFRANVRPEVDALNYASRVTVPTLMLNGRYDMNYPLDRTVKPLFDLLATPREHKRSVVYETDHFVPHNEYMKETLAWLDRYLGPVK